jgi:hypothetical protein
MTHQIHKEDETMETKMYRFITDPGHGWLEVPIAEIKALGIADKISAYSYRKGNMAYLEEDCDAGLFLNAAGIPKTWIYRVYQENTPIRGYVSFHRQAA